MYDKTGLINRVSNLHKVNLAFITTLNLYLHYLMEGSLYYYYIIINKIPTTNSASKSILFTVCHPIIAKQHWQRHKKKTS